MKKSNRILATLIAILNLGAVTCVMAADPAKEEAKVDPDSIYARLGGQPAINAAVDKFYVKVLADDRVNFFFENVNMDRQARKQKEFLAAAFGGPEPYEGKDLRTAHEHLDLREEDFAAIAEHLQATLEELKVDEELIEEIMTLVASTKDAVLNRKPSAE